MYNGIQLKTVNIFYNDLCLPNFVYPILQLQVCFVHPAELEPEVLHGLPQASECLIRQKRHCLFPTGFPLLVSLLMGMSSSGNQK